jgi:predicted aminopeptidase
MTEQDLNRHRRWCRQKWNGNGDDVFQAAFLIAMERYGIDKVNQSLFGKICREAARVLLYHEKHEIPFSYLVTENQDQTDEVEYDPEDPEWQKEYIAIEKREEIQKIHGQWLLDALLKTTEPKPSKVTTNCTYVEEQMKLFEFV